MYLFVELGWSIEVPVNWDLNNQGCTVLGIKLSVNCSNCTIINQIKLYFLAVTVLPLVAK